MNSRPLSITALFGRGFPRLGIVALAISLAACGSKPEQTVVAAALQTPTGIPGPTQTAAQASPTPSAAVAATSTRIPYRLQPGELLLAAPDDAIPALFADDSLFVSAGAGSQEWEPQDPVIGLSLGSQSRAYPVRLLSQHEIVNDVVGGVPVAVTWCPLCYSAIVFDRRVQGVERTFGVSGYLLNSNLVMYDHQTNTLWSQLLTHGIRGADNGVFLNLYPAELTTWSAWVDSHPETQVLSAERLGRQADEVIDPYVGYYSSGVAGFQSEAAADDRLPAKSLVVGLTLGQFQRAYPVDRLMAAGMIHDSLGETPVLLVYDSEFQTVLVYERAVEGQTLTFQAAGPQRMNDLQTGSEWNVQSGEALAGPLKSTRLRRLAAPLVFWFAWSAHYPAGELYPSLEED